MSGLVRGGLVAVGWCSDYSLARAKRSLPPPSAVASRDAEWQSATVSHGLPLVFRETIQVDGEVKGTMFEGALRCSRRVRPHSHCCACLLILACCRIFPIFLFPYRSQCPANYDICGSDPVSLGETLGPELPFLVVASRRSDRIPCFSPFARSRNSLAFAPMSRFLESHLSGFIARGPWTTDSVYCLVHKASGVIAWTTVSCSTLFSSLLCY